MSGFSYTAVDSSEFYRNIYLIFAPRCGLHEQAAAFNLSGLAIRVVFSLYLKVGVVVSICFGDTHP